MQKNPSAGFVAFKSTENQRKQRENDGKQRKTAEEMDQRKNEGNQRKIDGKRGSFPARNSFQALQA